MIPHKTAPRAHERKWRLRGRLRALSRTSGEPEATGSVVCSRAMTVHRRTFCAWASTAFLSAVLVTSCKDRGQKSANEARPDVQKLVELTSKDVAEVER